MNKKKWILVLLLAAMVLGVGWYLYQRARMPDDALRFQGNVDVRQVSLAFNDANRVREVLVHEGDVVHVGQVLARLDATSLGLQLTQSQAQTAAQMAQAKKLQSGARPEELAQAKANMDAMAAQAQQARQQLQRLQGAHSASESQAVSKVELESAQARATTAQAQYTAAQKSYELLKVGARVEDKHAAQAQVDAAKAQTALLQQRVDDAELKSPVDGVVRARLLEVGDMASPQKAAFEIALTQPKWVRIYVPETALGKIQLDMPAHVRVDDGTELTGKVSFIASVAEFTPKTVQTEELRTQLVYEVRVLVDDANQVLKLGMPATVVLKTSPKS